MKNIKFNFNLNLIWISDQICKDEFVLKDSTMLVDEVYEIPYFKKNNVDFTRQFVLIKNNSSAKVFEMFNETIEIQDV